MYPAIRGGLLGEGEGNPEPYIIIITPIFLYLFYFGLPPLFFSLLTEICIREVVQECCASSFWDMAYSPVAKDFYYIAIPFAFLLFFSPTLPFRFFFAFESLRFLLYFQSLVLFSNRSFSLPLEFPFLWSGSNDTRGSVVLRCSWMDGMGWTLEDGSGLANGDYRVPPFFSFFFPFRLLPIFSLFPIALL